MVVREPERRDTAGVFGSGLFIINPLWGLSNMLEEVMPWLASVLDEDGAAGFDLEHHIP